MSLLESNTMQAGTQLPPFELADIENQSISSERYENAKALLVVFTCNHCPYAVASWPIFIDLQNKYGPKGLQILAINSNNNPAYPDDSFEKMKPYAEKIGLNFPYLFDADQSIARAYDATCTPDPFLFKAGKLAYHGRINDNWQSPNSVTEQSLELQIQAALGEEAQLPSKNYPSMGCSIKWVSS